MQKPQYLLLEDVDGLGRTGDLVQAKAGFINNFLLPKQKAVRADKRTVRMQERLQSERSKQAEIDKKISLEISGKCKDLVIERRVKVDPEGKMYGSVGATEIEELLKEKGIEVDKKFIRLHHAIKETGVHTVPLKLKEEVECFVKIKVLAEGFVEPTPVVEEVQAEETTEE